MNKVTSSKANQEFTKLTSLVDSEGSAVITKNGKDMYVIMKNEEYLKLKERSVTAGIRTAEDILETIRSGESAFWIKDEGSIIRIDPTGENRVKLVSIEIEDGEAYGYTIGDLPKENIAAEDAPSWDGLDIRVYQRPAKGETATFGGGDYQYLKVRGDDENKDTKELIEGVLKTFDESGMRKDRLKDCRVKYIWDVPR